MNDVKHTIHFHGNLKKYGEKFELYVNSPIEAVKLLTMQIDGLGQAIRDGFFRIVRGDINKGFEYPDAKGENGLYDYLGYPLGGKSQDLHFIPVLQGSGGGGGGGAGKVIIGAVIMIAAVALAGPTGGVSITAGLAAFEFGFLGATAFAVGASIALSGVSQMMAPTVNGVQQSQSMERADEKPSAFLSSPINMSEWGGALPVAYGECFVGSYMINNSLETVEI